MLYRVFNTQTEVDEANQRWIIARNLAGVHDTKQGTELDPEITQKWDDGKVMLDGRIACQVPTVWADEFGGLELELGENDFPIQESMEV